MSTSTPPAGDAASRRLKIMRWSARILSVVWAYWASALGLFFMGQGFSGDSDPNPWLPTVGFLGLAALSLTPAILAGVWGRERLGGTWLLVNAALVTVGLFLGLVSIVVQVTTGPDPEGLGGGIVVLGLFCLLTMVAPAVVSGVLFRRTSKGA